MYSIRQVAEKLHISPITLRAWEQRYGLVRPQRTKGGHRLYSDDDVKRLKIVLRLMEKENLRISEAVRRLEAEDTAAQASLSATEWQSVRRELLDALLTLNEEQAGRTWEKYWLQLSVEAFLFKLLIPVMEELGDLWQTGKVNVAEEHFVTCFVMSRLQGLGRLYAVRHPEHTVCCAAPEEEKHILGLMIFALYLRQQGLPVIFTGAETPLSDLLLTVKKRAVKAVALTISNAARWPTVVRYVQALEQQDVTLVIGGLAHSSVPPDLSGRVIGSDIVSWQAWLDRWMSQTKFLS
jgi:DNA-binding transcriptional MerR regulator